MQFSDWSALQFVFNQLFLDHIEYAPGSDQPNLSVLDQPPRVLQFTHINEGKDHFQSTRPELELKVQGL